jgi:GrpB-like predicted nucleotidyltransferase (UPF0157 family)
VPILGIVHADEPIEIVTYDPSWPLLYEQERIRLQTAIGSWATGGIHHVGSTAVPGLDAKPIIDILLGVDSLDASRGCIEALGALDYKYAPYRPEEMHWLCKPSPSRRTHHLHLVPSGSERYRQELAFRDALRANPATAREYAHLKRRLAAAHREDREAYTAAKGDFIAQVLAGRRAV